MRKIIQNDPFINLNEDKEWQNLGLWPCQWVGCPEKREPPFVSAYRLRFTAAEDSIVVLHVTADERYELYLDGQFLGRGPERGDPFNWFFETYEINLLAGEHVLVARAWSFGEKAGEAQMSVHPGFLLAGEGNWLARLSTGLADWECKYLEGYAFLSPGPAKWRDCRIQIDGRRYPWGSLKGEGEGWLPVKILAAGMGRWLDWQFYQQHRLQPATLPPMLTARHALGKVRHIENVTDKKTMNSALQAANHLASEAIRWQALLSRQAVIIIPAGSRKRVVVDLEDYYTVYPEVILSGGEGGCVRLSWTESLRHQPDPWNTEKGQRDEIEGKYFAGIADEFLLDGGKNRTYRPLVWQAGRYLEIYVETAGEPLVLHSLVFEEYRYPLEMESSFGCSDERLNAVLPLLVRGQQMNMRETYSDCPYYEDLMYAGDTRLECLVTYMMTRDDCLPRKALRLFDASRLASGHIQSRYPCRVTQVIPPFSLWWIGMVYEYALWRQDLDFVRHLLPGVRATLEGFRHDCGEDGFLYAAEGWNILDWVTEWDQDSGIPPGGITGISGTLNWQLVYVLTLAAKLEEHLGEAEFTSYYKRWADELTERCLAIFWDEERGLMADDITMQHFSEHAQVLAVLSGKLDTDKKSRILQGLLHEPSLARASYHFLYYLLEAFRILGESEAILERLGWWHRDMVLKGLKTPLERFEPSRSDCHAWSSHPLYHFFASVLGIRPAGFGFSTVEINPQLGSLQWAKGRLVHPAGGEIGVEVRQENGILHGVVELPEHLSGTLLVNEKKISLPAGKTDF
jgi:alpha-L-rhamnosidase